VDRVVAPRRVFAGRLGSPAHSASRDHRTSIRADWRRRRRRLRLLMKRSLAGASPRLLAPTRGRLAPARGRLARAPRMWFAAGAILGRGEAAGILSLIRPGDLSARHPAQSGCDCNGMRRPRGSRELVASGSRRKSGRRRGAKATQRTCVSDCRSGTPAGHPFVGKRLNGRQECRPYGDATR
jgi:hypothetical protein